MSDASLTSGRLSFLAPLARQFWMIALIVTVGGLSALAYGRMQVPQYEASAVVQTRAGLPANVIAERILGRDNLLAMATRQHLSLAGTSRATTAVLLRRAISVNDLTSQAGQALGFQPQVAGIVVSALLPDAEVSARIANDLAQQILDLGNSGLLGADQDALDFYRRDEQRLWQEVSALTAEQEQTGTVAAADAALANQRQLALMQDQYTVVRQKLAEGEVAARLALTRQAGQFSLLRRATATEAVNMVQDWMLVGVAGSLLLAVTLAFVLERRYPALQRTPWRGFAQVYSLFDDPARPILGIPRYAVTSALIVVWLYLLAGFIR